MIGASAKTGERYEIVRTARKTRNIEKHADLVTAIDGVMKSPKSGLPYLISGSYFRTPSEHTSSYLMADGTTVTLAHEVRIGHHEAEIGRWLNMNAKGWYAHNAHDSPSVHYVYFEQITDAIYFKLRWF